MTRVMERERSLAVHLREAVRELRGAVRDGRRDGGALDRIESIAGELAQRETLWLNLPAVWRGMARREREQAERFRQAGDAVAALYAANSAGRAAGLEAAADRIEEVFPRA